MTTPDITIPPGLQSLFESAGSTIRYRVLRDLLDHDESWIQTAQLSKEIRKIQSIGDALAALQALKIEAESLLSFNSEQTLESGEGWFLMLCEAGQEQHPVVLRVVEKLLLPILADPDHLGGWPDSVIPDLDAQSGGFLRKQLRRLVRDRVLFMICRTLTEPSEYIQPYLETLLVEMEQFPSNATPDWPTRAGYAAVCWYPWSEDDFPRVRNIVIPMVKALESSINKLDEHKLLRQNLLTLGTKEEYLSIPELSLLELESAARLGIVRDLSVTRWLLEELEARQDADGSLRFTDTAPRPANHSRYPWYFPLEARSPEDYSIEYTFRALHIFKLLGYDW